MLPVLPRVDDKLPLAFVEGEWLFQIGVVWFSWQMTLRKRGRRKGIPDGWNGNDKEH